MTIPAAASAQTQPVASSSPPSPTTESGAPSEASVSPVIREARARFDHATTLFEAGNYAGAIDDFRHAYDLLNGDPRQYSVLFDIAQCFERTYRFDTALEYYRRYLTEGGARVTDRPTVEANIAALEQSLGTIDVITNVPRAQVFVDEHDVSVAPGAVRVTAGHHTIELRAPGHEAAQRTVDVTSGAHVPLTVALSAAPRTSPVVQRARERFDLGSALFDRGNYEAALAEFEQVYELLDGQPRRFMMLYNMAQASERLARYDTALEYYRRYLAEGGADAPDRSLVQATMQMLDTLLGVVVVQVNVPRAGILVDAHEVRATAPGEVRVSAGRHVVRVRAEGYLPEEQEVVIATGVRRTIQFTLRRRSEFHGLPPAYFWTAATIGVAGLLVGGAIGTVAIIQNNEDTARAMDPVGQWLPPDLRTTEQQRIRTLATAADVSYAVGGVFAVGAVVLFLVTDRRGPQTRAHSFNVGPRAEGGAFVTYEARF